MTWIRPQCFLRVSQHKRGPPKRVTRPLPALLSSLERVPTSCLVHKNTKNSKNLAKGKGNAASVLVSLPWMKFALEKPWHGFSSLHRSLCLYSTVASLKSELVRYNKLCDMWHVSRLILRQVSCLISTWDETSFKNFTCHSWRELAEWRHCFYTPKFTPYLHSRSR